MFKSFLLVGIGGFLGSAARFAVSIIIKSPALPLATLSVNILGSCIIGVVMGWSLHNNQLQDDWRLFLASGLCGGFTTFSAFSMENIQLMQEGKIGLCLVYILGSVLLGMAAAWIGFRITS